MQKQKALTRQAYERDGCGGAEWESEKACGSDICSPGKLLFCSWSVIPSLPWNSLAPAHTHKHHSFQLLRCDGSEKPFLFVLLFQEQPISLWKLWNICQRVGTVARRPTPWKVWEGWRHIFQLGKEKVWASIYKRGKCVCIRKQATFQMSVSMNSHQNQGVTG